MTHPLIDQDALKDLTDVLGDGDVADLMVLLRAELPRYFQGVQDALAAGDLATAVRQAHALKGSSLNMCLVRLGRAAAALEQTARAGQVPSDDDMAQVGACLAETLAAIARY